MKNKSLFFLSFMMAFVLAITAGCGPRGYASVSEDYIRELAETKLQAINQRDHLAFTTDFSNQLKEAFTQEVFTDFSDTVLSASGKFESITGSRISNTQSKDYVSYVYSTKFENENVTLTLVYVIDGNHVEGIFFNGPKLNRAFQAKQ